MKQRSYFYKALNAEGVEVSGTLEAPHLNGARDLLQLKGLKEVELRHQAKAENDIGQALLEADRKIAPDRVAPHVFRAQAFVRQRIDRVLVFFMSLWRRGSVWTSKERCNFLRQLAVMEGSGMTLNRALRSLAEHETIPVLQEKILKMVGTIEHTNTEARDADKDTEFGDESSLIKGYRESGLFSRQQVAVLAAGETSGTMSKCLLELAQEEEAKVAFSNRVSSQLFHPGLVIGFLWLGLPVILKQVSSVGGSFAELVGPGKQSVLFDTLKFLGHPAVLASLWLGPLLACLALFAASRDEDFVEKMKDTGCKIPGLSSVIESVRAAQLLRVLGQLLAVGVEIRLALRVSSEVAMKEPCLLAIERLSQGESLDIALGVHLPTVARTMMDTGEKSGCLPEMLLKAASIMEDEAAFRIEGFTQLLEPILMAFVGLVVAGLCLLSLLPMAKLIENLM